MTIFDSDGRYQDLGLIGRGGMAEVHRVRDRRINRTLAMKVLAWDLADATAARVAFLREARITAQLQHPAIIPVHDQGKLKDGRPWFTMKEVRGRTFSEWIAAMHAAHDGAVSTEKGAPPTVELRRMVAALLRACEGLACAHQRGVIHRDVKPQNLMIGDWGEVLVMDWGMAREIGREAPRDSAGIKEALSHSPPADRTPAPMSLAELDDHHTLAHQPTLANGVASSAGGVTGTLAYMPPEQASGSPPHPTADVYALGATIYTMMSGQAPYQGSSARLLAQLRRGPPPPLRSLAPSPFRPAALCELAEHAMARRAEERFADAASMAAALRDWLDGTARRQRALLLVAEADRDVPAITALWRRAREGERKANQQLSGIQAHDAIALKLPAWQQQDAAAALAQQAALKQVGWLQLLRSALNEVPTLPEAHQRLADHYHSELQHAEAQRQPQRALRNEALLRAHDGGAHAAFLRGDAPLTLLTQPEEARTTLFRYVERTRALSLQYVRALGPTPLININLPRGSYLLVIRRKGHAAVRYPVFIERGGGWHGRRPTSASALPIWLPKEGQLAPDDCYVPAGWFIAGGDPDAGESLARRWLWADAIIMKRDPVVNGAYLAFLNALHARGDDDQAIQWAPRGPRGRSEIDEAQLLYARDGAGRWVLPGEGAVQQHPVIGVDRAAARAYCHWRGEQDKLPWRLPNELEWEKAARGVDGRFMPWGDYVEPTRAGILPSRAGPPGLVSVDHYLSDVSPYGVRGMAGNARDWCSNEWTSDGPPTEDGVVVVAARPLTSPASSTPEGLHAVRGGCWFSTVRYCRLATRFAAKPSDWMNGLGFRLARSV